jgi:hypothetical protein
MIFLSGLKEFVPFWKRESSSFQGAKNEKVLVLQEKMHDSAAKSPALLQAQKMRAFKKEGEKCYLIDSATSTK